MPPRSRLYATRSGRSSCRTGATFETHGIGRRMLARARESVPVRRADRTHTDIHSGVEGLRFAGSGSQKKGMANRRLGRFVGYAERNDPMRPFVAGRASHTSSSAPASTDALPDAFPFSIPG